MCKFCIKNEGGDPVIKQIFAEHREALRRMREDDEQFLKNLFNPIWIVKGMWQEISGAVKEAPWFFVGMILFAVAWFATLIIYIGNTQ